MSNFFSFTKPSAQNHENWKQNKNRTCCLSLTNHLRIGILQPTPPNYYESCATFHSIYLLHSVLYLTKLTTTLFENQSSPTCSISTQVRRNQAPFFFRCAYRDVWKFLPSQARGPKQFFFHFVAISKPGYNYVLFFFILSHGNMYRTCFVFCFCIFGCFRYSCSGYGVRTREKRDVSDARILCCVLWPDPIPKAKKRSCVEVLFCVVCCTESNQEPT